MNQHRRALIDRRIALNDYIVNCQVKSEVKIIQPLIVGLHKDMEEKNKNNIWCNGCGELRYKCYCNVLCPHCGKTLIKCSGDSETGECPNLSGNN
jgi:hypothetical protein